MVITSLPNKKELLLAPTQQELDSCEWLVLTNHQPWNPKEVVLGKVKTEHEHADACDVRLPSTQAPGQTTCECSDPKSDEAILHQSSNSTHNLKEHLKSESQETSQHSHDEHMVD